MNLYVKCRCGAEFSYCYETTEYAKSEQDFYNRWAQTHALCLTVTHISQVEVSEGEDDSGTNS